jgi:hypothetical protein
VPVSSTRATIPAGAMMQPKRIAKPIVAVLLARDVLHEHVQEVRVHRRH